MEVQASVFKLRWAVLETRPQEKFLPHFGANILLGVFGFSRAIARFLFVAAGLLISNVLRGA